jgi:protein phosphatase 1 regulatory subunit 26
MDSRTSVPPGHTAAKSEAVHQASRLAVTSIGLMCAEAILDLSETILSASMLDSDKPSSRNPFFCLQPMPPCSEGDSSNIDSVDSIEQEIRIFLALKPQVGSPQPAQGPQSSPGPSGQPGIPKAPPAKIPDLPLGCKRKQRGGGSTTVSKKIREGGESAQDTDHIQGKVQPGHDRWDPLGHSKIRETPGGEAEAKEQPVTSRTAGLSDTHLPQGHGSLRMASEQERSEDKSSSLDSDEDLDMAIKDLLRSKRKFKRCRDPQASFKKVRLGTAETRCVEKLSNLAGDWRDHRLWSSLPKCRGDNKDGPGSAFSSVAERVKLGGTGGKDAIPAVLSRRKNPKGAPPSKDTGASGHPPSASSSTSENSTVDSDDNIELEIRRFLVEKAKESTHNAKPQGGPAKPEMPCKKEPTLELQPGVCTQSQKARGTPQLAKEGRRGPERAQTQATSLLSQTGRGTFRAEQTTGLTTALGRSEASLPENSSAKHGMC